MTEANGSEVMHEHMVAISTLMRERIDVSPEGRKSVEEKISALGFSEERLWKEWVNETIFSSTEDPSTFEAAAADPLKAYRTWVAERITDEFRVPAYVVTKACRRHSPEVAVRIAMVTWRQEIAWAQRSRRSDDDRVVVLSSLFLKAVKADPGKYFLEICDVNASRSGEFSYVNSPAHNLDEFTIRFGPRVPEFMPHYRTVAEAEFGDRLNGTDGTLLKKMADKSRQTEVDEIQRHTRKRAAKAIQGANMRRLTTVIQVAIERELSSDELFACEKAFLAAVESGGLRLDPDSGLPYAEFVDWVRAGNIVAISEKPASMADLQAIAKNRGAFLDRLPSAYHELDCFNLEHFVGWMSRYSKEKMPPPIDLQLDYGFYLVRRSFRQLQNRL